MKLHIDENYSFQEYVTYDFSWPDRAGDEYDWFTQRMKDYLKYLEAGGHVTFRQWMYAGDHKDKWDWDYGDLFCTMSRYINGDCECHGHFECPFALKGDSCMEYLLTKEDYPLRLRIKVCRKCVELLEKNREPLVAMLKEMKESLLELESKADDYTPCEWDDGARDSDYEEGR